MRNTLLILGVIIILITGFIFLKSAFQNPSSSKIAPKVSSLPVLSGIPQFTVVAENLDTPWAIAFLPDPPAGRAGKSMLITERVGRVKLINNDGKVEDVATLSQVKEIGEGGLMGIVLHPDFSTNRFVYLYYTYSESGSNTLNRVVRMKYENNVLKDEQIIVDRIPGAPNHNGGRIKFGPDKFLYITTGDAQNPSLSQDKNSLAGKILRVTDEGKEASGNPFGNQVYSYGHRNPQGLAWDSQGKLWATEHGQSAQDEVNIVYPGKNYGWPEVRGSEFKKGLEIPYKHSGSDTWAPAGAAIVDESLYFAGLRGAALYYLQIGRIVAKDVQPRELLKQKFGRLREVVLGSDGMLYITTSNKDGRGKPKVGDDKVIRINPSKL